MADKSKSVALAVVDDRKSARFKADLRVVGNVGEAQDLRAQRFRRRFRGAPCHESLA
ncbi:MAG: hypothetical protein V9G24_04490 [Rhodoblastus sp.]